MSLEFDPINSELQKKSLIYPGITQTNFSKHICLSTLVRIFRDNHYYLILLVKHDVNSNNIDFVYKRMIQEGYYILNCWMLTGNSEFETLDEDQTSEEERLTKLRI